MKKQAGPIGSKMFYLVLAAKPWMGWVPKAPCKGGFWTQSPAKRVFSGGWVKGWAAILDLVDGLLVRAVAFGVGWVLGDVLRWLVGGVA